MPKQKKVANITTNWGFNRTLKPLNITNDKMITENRTNANSLEKKLSVMNVTHNNIDITKRRSFDFRKLMFTYHHFNQ